MSCNCGCNGADPNYIPCPECEALSDLEQLVLDAVANEKTELEHLRDDAKESADAAAESADEAAQSASEAKHFRDDAQTAANSATGSLKTIMDNVLILEESGKLIQQAADDVLTAIASIAVRTWYYTITTDGQTQIPVPVNMNVLAVQNIYIEGVRQDLNRGFTFDKTTMTITLARGLPKGMEITVVLGAYNTDSAESFPVTLASNNGAALVGTSSGKTVQEELNKLVDPNGSTLYPELQIARWRDEGDLRGWDAKGDGITDDTAAFTLMEATVTDRVIDLGGRSYVVKNPFYKNEYINGSFIIDGSLHPASFDLNALRYKKICATFYTGDVGIPGQDPIFEGAGGVFQAFCLIPVNGQVKMYVTQRATGPLPFLGNFLKNETYRIVEYTFKEDGSQIVPTAFSQPLTTCGHANMLGYRYEGSELYFYTGAPNDSETDTTLGGKGFTRVHWKGSATSDADVTRYEMFDQPGVVGGVYNTHCRTNVTVSPDGKYLLLVTDDTATGDHAALIYDLDTVLASTNLKSLVPLHEFRVPPYYSSPLQGIAMNDKYVFVYYDWEVNTSALKIFDFAGNLVSDIDNIDFLRTVHTRDEYLGGFGVLTTCESENVTLFGNDLYVGYREIWYEIGTIVSYEGGFYTPKVAVTGIPPNSSSHWMPVSVTAGAVPYSETTAYTVTGAKKANLKRVIKIGSLKESRSVPIQGKPDNPVGPKIRDPNLRYIANSGSFQWERWEENTKRFMTTLRVSEAGNWYYHDTTSGAYTEPGAMLTARNIKVGGLTSRYARLRGGDGTGGGIILYAADDGSKPGAIVENVGLNNSICRETNQYGETVIKSNTDASKVPLRTDVQGTGDFIRGSRYDTVYFGIRTSTVNTIMTSRSGNTLVLGASSSVDGFTSDTTARVNINITDMAFRPDVDNNLDNGKVNYRWKQVFATNSSIGTSDATHKTEPRNITQAEVMAFATIARLPSVWQWLSKYQIEGDDARLHAGPTVQAAIAIMEANGLDWSRYSAFCYDEWEDQYEPVLALRKVEKEVMVEREGFEYPEWVEVDEEYDTGEKTLVKAAGSVYSFRKEELLWWCHRALASQLDRIEDRLNNLERIQKD